MKTKYSKEKWRFSQEHDVITTSEKWLVEEHKTIASINSNVNWDETKNWDEIRSEAEANGVLISCSPALLQTCLNNYIFHQRKSRVNIDYAIETDSLRAELRHEISRAIGVEDVVFQNWIEHICKFDQNEIGYIKFT